MQSTVSILAPYMPSLKKMLALSTRQLHLNAICPKFRSTHEDFTDLLPSMYATDVPIGFRYYGSEKVSTGVCNNWTMWVFSPAQRGGTSIWHKRNDYKVWLPLPYMPAVMWVNWSRYDTKKWTTLVSEYKILQAQRKDFMKLKKDLSEKDQKKSWEEHNMKRVAKYVYKFEPDYIGLESFIFIVLIIVYFHLEILPFWFAKNKAAKTEIYDPAKHKINITFEGKDPIALKFGIQYFGSTNWNKVYQVCGFR